MNKLLVQGVFKSIIKQPRYFLHPDKIIKYRQEKSGYYMNPEDVTRRFIKLLALHDDVKNPEAITLNSTWDEIGLKEMNYVEVMVEAEREFEIEIPDEDVERFRSVNDAVEYISRSFFSV